MNDIVVLISGREACWGLISVYQRYRFRDLNRSRDIGKREILAPNGAKMRNVRLTDCGSGSSQLHLLAAEEPDVEFCR